MKSLAFFNNKGGVGKTTLLCNVASFLAKRHSKRILIVDADPQCNATQSVFSDEFINRFYSRRTRSSIYSVVQPLAAGKGFTATIRTDRSHHYEVDVVPGDPRLALSEDLLAEDWSSATAGKVRGLRTTFLFKHLLSHFQAYDYVLFDMGPSLGSINRSVLIAVDFYVVPMSIDIFSIRAVENISSWIASWRSTLERGLELLDDEDDLEIRDTRLLLRFAGYVNQQYTAKRDAEGKRVAVKAYDKIMKDIPGVVRRELVDKLERDKARNMDYSLGEIPNLHSLIPLSQTTKTPIFELGYREGIVGAHYSKVRDASGIFKTVTKRLLENIGDM